MTKKKLQYEQPHLQEFQMLLEQLCNSGSTASRDQGVCDAGSGVKAGQCGNGPVATTTSIPGCKNGEVATASGTASGCKTGGTAGANTVAKGCTSNGDTPYDNGCLFGVTPS